MLSEVEEHKKSVVLLTFLFIFLFLLNCPVLAKESDSYADTATETTKSEVFQEKTDTNEASSVEKNESEDNNTKFENEVINDSNGSNEEQSYNEEDPVADDKDATSDNITSDEFDEDRDLQIEGKNLVADEKESIEKDVLKSQDFLTSDVSDSHKSESKSIDEESLSESEADETREANNIEPETETAENSDSLKDKDVLSEGKFLEMDSLAKEPITLGSQDKDSSSKVVEVNSFEELKEAIKNAGNKKTTIKIMSSFQLTDTIIIDKDQDIILTADNNRKQDTWEKIKQPADYAKSGEKKQREIIEEARKRGEDAIKKADLNKNPLPSETKGDKILKRAKDFKDTLFNVFGKLTLGTKDSAIYIDGNKDVKTEHFDKGSVIDVNGELVMKNAVVMNSVNHHGYTAPIRVNNGGKFVMEGGRISSNTSYEKIEDDSSRPTSAGAIYVEPGGSFTMKSGIIDNNNGGMAGGVYAGDFFGSDEKPAIINIEGGIIASNKSNTRFQSGGGITGYPKSIINIIDGIIANNKSRTGGGIAISDQYISDFKNILGDEFADLSGNYDKHRLKNKAEANINGGLIYKNHAYAVGGGVYVDTNDVKFGNTMILDNTAGNFGGGIYISFPPRVQKLEDILITENLASGILNDDFGSSNGGGIWNCPTGYVHIGDGHSIYVYNNEATNSGKDITFSKKTWQFLLNGKNIKGEFYSHISPITKDKNIIKFIEDGKSGLDIPENLSYTRNVVNLKAYYDEALKREAWRNSRTFVLGNKARNGGGLGSNANLETPKDEGDYKIELNKKWDGSINKKDIPKDIDVDIFIVPLDKDKDYVKKYYGTDNSLFKYGEITLSKKDNWKAVYGYNYFNGMSKEEVLKKLGIKSFSEIGLPEDAYNMDRGLPFTAEELAKKGYKYLVVEQGDDYLVKVEESMPEKEKEMEAGVVEVKRNFSDDWDTNENTRKDQNIYFYYYDPVKQKLTRIAKTELNENNKFKSSVSHPIFLKEISKIEYYGENRKFQEYEGWESVVGYNNTNNGYAIVVLENEDGTLTLEIPAIYPDIYDENPNVGFRANQTREIREYIVKGNNHSFTITNYKFGKMNVEKSWKEIDKKDVPDSLNLYLLLDGKRVIEGYDSDGNPIYKSLVLTSKDGWKGSFDRLDPIALGAGRYSLEEDSDIFAPEIIIKDLIYKIHIGYASTFHEEGQNPNEQTTTAGQFPSYVFKNEDGSYDKVKLHLYLDGKLIDTKYFTFNSSQFEVNGEIYETIDFNKDAIFDDIRLPIYGTPIRIGSYDVITNEPGLKDYNFYIKKDENGIYTLYLPRLVIDGVPYDNLFIVKENDLNSSKVNAIINQGDEKTNIEINNYYGPNHEIEILKNWIDGSDKVPEEITIVIKDNSGNSKEITLTKDEDWKKVLENLEGTLRNNNYTIEEVKVPNFDGVIKTEKSGIEVSGKDKNGKDISFVYTNEELKKVLSNGNYRYEVFELGEDSPEFNLDNLDSFIKIEQEKNGNYIIRYAKGINLTEILSVNLTNTYVPPEEPPETPPEEPEEPPKTPPEEPKEPPKTPPENPEEPPKIPPEEPETPPKTPTENSYEVETLSEVSEKTVKPVTPKIEKTPEGKAPKTGVSGDEKLLLLMITGLVGLYETRRKREDQ